MRCGVVVRCEEQVGLEEPLGWLAWSLWGGEEGKVRGGAGMGWQVEWGERARGEWVYGGVEWGGVGHSETKQAGRGGVGKRIESVEWTRLKDLPLERDECSTHDAMPLRPLFNPNTHSSTLIHLQLHAISRLLPRDNASTPPRLQFLHYRLHSPR